MLTTVKIVGFIDADGQQQLSLIRYPTEVIFLEGRPHWDDETQDKYGRIEFHDDATRLPEWCANHYLTYVYCEKELELNEGFDG
jgi:hypothetical protein